MDYGDAARAAKVTLRTRAVIRGPVPQSALVIVNNRVVPGHPTILLPGGGVEEGETPVQALQRELAEELGIGAQLDDSNTRFVLSRRYEFPGRDGGPPALVELGFFEVNLPGVVPRNMEPESVVGVDWMTLREVRRYTSDPEGRAGWRVALGVLDGMAAVLDPRRNGEELGGGGGREVGREDAPRARRPAGWWTER